MASGSRPELDERVNLWRSFATVIDALAPRAVLLENVPDMATWDDGAILLDILQSLRERGFAAEARVLQAGRYGVPQHRQRLFIAARRSGSFSWPKADETPVDLKAAIGDLPVVRAGQRDSTLRYEGPQSQFQIGARAGVPPAEAHLIHDHVTRAVRADDAEAYELLEPGQTYRDLPARLKRYREDIFDDKYKRLAWDKVSRSITAHIARDGYWYIHPDQPRTLSIREAARIQTFPDVFRFCGYPSIQFRQIGNAVPPALGEAVAKRVVEALRSRAPIVPSRFSDLLRATTEEPPGRPGPTHAWRVVVELFLGPRPVDRAVREVMSVARTPEKALDATARLQELLGDRKAHRLTALAQLIVTEHGGKVPRDEAALRRLPGLGLQAVGYIRAFGFAEDTVIASEATRRIVERITGLQDLSTWTVRLHLLQLSGAAGPDPRFNRGLLDLAQDVCRPTPLCGSCPVRRECAHGRNTAHMARIAGDEPQQLAA